MQYFIGKRNCFPTNSKAGKHSICKVLVENDFPEKLDGLEDISEHTYYTLVEQTDAPKLPVLMLFRDPVERFISGASMNHGLIPIEESLAMLGHNQFDKQIDYIIEGKTIIFKFPEEIGAFCEAAGFPNLPKINEANGEKKVLTEEQLQIVKNFYADDIAFYETL